MYTYNLQETYVDDADPWMFIFASDAFAVLYKYHHVNGKIPRQLVFVRDTILPIMHIANWRYICPQKQAQIDKLVI